MSRLNLKGASLSISSRGLSAQLAAGIALVSTVPLLCLWYMLRQEGTQSVLSPWHLGVMVLAVFAAMAGYLLLKNSIGAISALRSRVQSSVSPEMVADLDLTDTENDVIIIQKCLDVMLNELAQKTGDLESEKQRVEKKLLRAQKMESLSTMATGMAHDYNNILAAILGNVALTLSTLPKDSPCRSNIQEIENSALRALTFTEDIQSYVGQNELIASTIALPELIAETLAIPDLKPPRGVKIIKNLAKDLPAIRGDACMLRRALTQLIMNAIEAVSDKGGKVSISAGPVDGSAATASSYITESSVDSPSIFLEIQDTGCGIPEKVYDKMFDPFYTTKLRGQGLGLSLVMGVVRSHGASISVTGNSDNGTTVRIVLPCRT